MSEQSYRGKGQPALGGGRIVGWMWTETPPVYRGASSDTPPTPPPPSGGLLHGLQRLLGVPEESTTPKYRQPPQGGDPKRQRLKSERPRPRTDE